MVEMSQVRAEEAKWTPQSVYDILPPNSLKFDGFDYLEGGDGVDSEKANKSLLEGFADWFKNLIGITGRIIGGAIELGVGVFKAVADGIQNFLGGIKRAFKAIFGDGPPPPEPIFSPFHADLEEAVRPHLDLIKKNSKEVSESIEKIETLQTEMQGVLGEVATIREETAKAIDDASAALVEAEAATAHADSLNSERVAAEELIRKTVTEALAAADSAKASADSKSTNFYGPTQPTTAKDGDTWFKPDPNTGKSVIYQRVDGAWVKNLDAAEIYDALAAVDTDAYNEAMSGLRTDLDSVQMDLARKINKGEVKTSDLTAGCVTAGALHAGAVTTDKLSANAVTSDKLAARSVYASHLVVSQPGNLIANGDMSSGQEPWNKDLSRRNNGLTTPPNGWSMQTAAGQGTMAAHGTDNWISVQPGQSYAFEIWLHSSVDSRFYISSVNQNGKECGTAGDVVTAGDMPTGGGAYFINGQMIGPQWKRYSCIYTINANTTKLRLDRFFFNRNGAGAKISFGGVSLRPMADASLIVDGSILAKHVQSGSIGTDQLAANAVKASNIDSDAIVARHIQADALSAREIKAEVFTQVGTNVIPLLPGTRVGAWTKNADNTGLNDTLGAGESGRWWSFHGTRQPGSLNMVSVNPDIEYDFEVWLHGTNNSRLYIELRDQDGNHAVASGGLTDNAYLTSPDSNGVVRQTGRNYLIGNFTLLTGWRKYKTRIKLKPDAKFVRIGPIYGSHPNGPEGSAYIAGMSLTPHIIPQAEVDALQNEAIKKNTLVGAKNIKAIDGLLQGIEGLERANVLQDQINQEQARINRKFQENDDTFLAIQRENMRVISRTIAATGNEIIYNNHMSLDPYNGKITFKPGWFGECIISWEEAEKVEYHEERYVSIARFSWKGSSEYVWSRSSASLSYGHKTRWLRVDYQVEPGVQKSVNLTNPNALMTAGKAASWTTMSQFTATTETGHYIEYRLTLKAANRGTRYGIRFLVNEVEKAVFWDDRVGPLTHLGNGEVPISLSKYVSDIKKGDKIEIQTYVASTNGAWDECFDQFGRITYIDQEG